jgi:hypothetical protein
MTLEAFETSFKPGEGAICRAKDCVSGKVGDQAVVCPNLSPELVAYTENIVKPSGDKSQRVVTCIDFCNSTGYHMYPHSLK